MSELIQEFNDYRSKMNEVILGQKNLTLNRFFNLDMHAYADGAIDAKTKEMLGLVASMVQLSANQMSVPSLWCPASRR